MLLNMPDEIFNLFKNEENCTIKNYPENTIILNNDTPENRTAVIINGIVSSYVCISDKQLFSQYHESKFFSILCFMNFYTNEPIPYKYVSLSETQTLWIPNQLILRKMSENIFFKKLIIKNYFEINNHCINLLSKIQNMNKEELVFDFLVERSKVLDTRTITIKQKEISNNLNIPTENICRILKALNLREKIIKQNANTFKILS